jgi:uncharacterized protein (TIGR02271 family)
MADTQTRVSGTVVGYFDNYSDAQEAVSRLKDAGFQASQIGLAARTSDAGYDSSSTTATTGTSAGSRVSSAAHEAGAKTEGMWQKVKNFFEGGDVEPYADERSRGDLADREITPNASYSDASDAYGAGSNDFRNTLSGLNVSDQHSRYFGHRFENSQSGAVVTVTAQGREAEAERILEDAGADLGTNAADYDYSNTSTASTGNANTVDQQRIQLLGEVLRVHKERVNRGEVRIGKQVVTDQQQVQVPVEREELVIERVPVAGSTPAQGTIGDSSDIRIPLTEERASIDKQTVVREEVAVGKRVVEGARTVSADVRHEELVVDDKSAPATSNVNSGLDTTDTDVTR